MNHRNTLALIIAYFLMVALLGIIVQSENSGTDNYGSPRYEEMILPSGKKVKVGHQAPPVSRYRIAGNRWPGKTIRYYDATPKGAYRTGVAKAVQEWNARKGGTRFVKVRSRSKAQFVISVDRKIGSGGLATVGYWGGSYKQYWVKLNMPRHKWEDVAWVASHELGHILGLDHSSGCSVMSYDAYTACQWKPKNGQEGFWRCRLQEPDDIRGFRRLYGGKPKIRKGVLCLKSKVSGKVTGLTGTVVGEEITLTWKRASLASKYKIARSEVNKKCVTNPATWSFLKQAALKNRRFTDKMPWMQEGKYCYTMWSVNKDGYVNPKSRATVIVNYVVPTPDPPEVAQLSISGSGWDKYVTWEMSHKKAGVIFIYSRCEQYTGVESGYQQYEGGSGGEYIGEEVTSGSNLCYRFWVADYTGPNAVYSESVVREIIVP